MEKYKLIETEDKNSQTQRGEEEEVLEILDEVEIEDLTVDGICGVY